MFVLMERALVLQAGRREQAHPGRFFIVAIALTALGAAMLRGVEATAWAVLYIWLGAMSDWPM